MSALSSNWNRLVTGIVRPPRAQYQDKQLGSQTFKSNEELFERLDEEVDYGGMKLMLTYFQPTENSNRWFILYTHGNSSSKLEAVGLLKYLPRGFSLGSFDFIGCGKNQERDYITLGVTEAEQITAVVEFLQNREFRVGVWGRSMGAASALLYGRAAFIIADSPFKSMRSLCKEIAQRDTPPVVPRCCITCLFPLVFNRLRSDVEKRASYDLNSLNIVEAVKRVPLTTLIIFLSGDKDQLINSSHSQYLFDTFAGSHKYLYMFDGDHNSRRPQAILRKVMDHILKLSENKGLLLDHLQISHTGMDIELDKME